MIKKLLILASIVGALCLTFYVVLFFSLFSNIILFSEPNKEKQAQIENDIRQNRDASFVHQNQEIVKTLFNKIKQRFPDLSMELLEGDEHVDLQMNIPKQPRLEFPVSLNLQGDELNINAGEHYWNQWFPCTDPEVQKTLDETVCGLITGDYRLVEVYKEKVWVYSYIQLPYKGRWTEEYGCIDLPQHLLHLFSPNQTAILRNHPPVRTH